MVDFIHTTLHGVTVSSSPPSLSLSALPFPFCFVWKILSREIPRFSLREWNSKFRLMASSWRNKTLRKRRMMKAARKKDPMYSCILFHFLLHILSSLKYTYSECKSLSKLLIHSHPPKSHANLIKKKKERESTQKTSPLSPFSGTQSIIRSRGSFRPRSSTSCTAKVKKKKEIRQKFLRNVLETRSSSTFLIRAILRPTSPSPLPLTRASTFPRIHGSQMIAAQPCRKLERVHRVNRGPRRSTPWVINRRNSDRKQRGIH